MHYLMMDFYPGGKWARNILMAEGSELKIRNIPKFG